MPIIPEVQSRLRAAFPQDADTALFRAVQEGSYLADHLFDGESFLNNQVGHDLRGHIRRIGIAHQLNLVCSRGDLPWTATMKPMPKGRWHWLEVTAQGALAHVCRTEDVFDFPAEADSRQDVRLALQPDLFTVAEKHRTLAEVLADVSQLYAWLTFRIGQDGRVSHLCWASPAADRDEWLAHINVLEQITRAGAEIPAISTVPDPKDKLRLKDHIAEALEKGAARKSGK
jgi:hypothetical protein